VHTFAGERYGLFDEKVILFRTIHN
jgi:hypothetical protein